MKITIESTEKLADLNGVDCRLWEGVTENGIPCKVFVHRVAVREDRDSSQFDRELSEMPPAVAVPNSMIFD